MKTPLLALLVTCTALCACQRNEAPIGEADSAPPPPTSAVTETPPPAEGPASAVAMLAGTKDHPVRGELHLSATDGGVRLMGEISGLTPGTEHGFHIHEHGDCSAPDASSAGAHLNPGNAPHGGPDADASMRHLGDLPNLKSNQEGRVEIAPVVIAGATLRDGGPNNLVGKAFIVHAKRDDYKTQPSGDSGDRIACGVVQ